MGDPKKIRKKYSTPNHPWVKGRIEEEKALVKEYNLRNKTEIYRANSILEGFKEQVKKLNTRMGPQAEKERAQLKERLLSIGIIKPGQESNTVLSLSVREILDRRLQTVLFKRHLSRTISQARQFIVHKHVRVGGKKVSSPGYIVPVKDEESIEFSLNSKLSDPAHPERYENLPEKKEEKQKRKEKKEEEIVAFKDIKDEEEIVKDIKPKKEEGEEKKGETQ